MSGIRQHASRAKTVPGTGTVRVPLLIVLAILALGTGRPGLAADPASDGGGGTSLSLKNPAANEPELARVKVVSGLSVHKETYILPVTWSDLYYGGESEIEFQISFKQQVTRLPFYFAYTQKSFWQAYNTPNSSPFRETDYNPEFFYRIEPRKLPGRWGLDVGAEHESNGQSGASSRSWNRVYIAPYLPWKRSLLYWKFWGRVPERAASDDNPDITDYTGWGELHFRHRFAGGQFVHMMFRLNPGTEKGAFSMNFSIPGPPNSYCYLFHVFSGYGESLIDYNRRNTRFGIGIIFAR